MCVNHLRRSHHTEEDITYSFRRNLRSLYVLLTSPFKAIYNRNILKSLLTIIHSENYLHSLQRSVLKTLGCSLWNVFHQYCNTSMCTRARVWPGCSINDWNDLPTNKNSFFFNCWKTYTYVVKVQSKPYLLLSIRDNESQIHCRAIYLLQGKLLSFRFQWKEVPSHLNNEQQSTCSSPYIWARNKPNGKTGETYTNQNILFNLINVIYKTIYVRMPRYTFGLRATEEQVENS